MGKLCNMIYEGRGGVGSRATGTNDLKSENGGWEVGAASCRGMGWAIQGIWNIIRQLNRVYKCGRRYW